MKSPKTENSRVRVSTNWLLTASVIAMALASPAFAQRPTLPEPRVQPKTPENVEMPRRGEQAHVNTTVQAKINTRQRARFDVHMLKLHDINLQKPRLRGRMLRADALNFDIVIGNGGSNTFAFPGNQVDASLIEGHFDYRQRVHIDRRGIPYYPARGIYDIVTRPGDGLDVPLVIRGQKNRKVGLWPVPLPNRYGAGLRAVKLKSGNAPLQIRPEVWYTINARLTPAKNDEIDYQHSVFVNVRFDNSGQVAELQGPYLYD